MSSAETDTRDEKTLTSALNQGLHPSNASERLRQYIPGDVDDDDADRVHNPHEWAEPERTWRERLIPQTTAKQILAAAGIAFAIGMILYLWPIIGPFFQSPTAIVLGAAIASYLLVWLHGNQQGMNRYRDLDKWVRVEGDGAKVAPVERIDEEADDGLPLFRTIKRLSYGGFNREYLRRRDLPYDTSELKDYPGDDGLEPVRDAGNAWTYTIETDNLGRFHVTDTSKLAFARGMKGAERFARPPEKLDQEKWREAERLIGELMHEIQSLRDDVEMLREHADRKGDLRDEMQVPQIEQTVRLMQELSDITDATRRRRRDRNEDQMPIAAAMPGQMYSYDSSDDDSEGN